MNSRLAPEVMTFIQDLSDFVQCHPLPLSGRVTEVVLCMSVKRKKDFNAMASHPLAKIKCLVTVQFLGKG